MNDVISVSESITLYAAYNINGVVVGLRET